ncbi:uncharacterized protein [Henckelia pumila]|uniref:uncharacterized protein n=1 Tax=Henckelia pumila TaxID=405737 RepID=UPI003C6E2BAA
MTAEAEVCNGAVSEVAGIEEKPEFKARSFQDLAEPELNGIGNHDQTYDPEDSYVLVTDVGDPSADGKDMAAADGSPRHESSAPVELLGIELDARNGNPEGAIAGKHGNAEGGDESSTLVNGITDVQLVSLVEGGEDQDTVEEDKSLEELSDQKGKINVVNGEADPTLTEGGIWNAVNTDENPSVGNGVLVEEDQCLEELTDKNGKINVVNAEHDPTLTEGRIRNASSTDENPSVGNRVIVEEDKCLEELNDKNGKINVVNAEPDPTSTEAGIQNAVITDENRSVGNEVIVVEDKCLEESTDKNGKLNVVNTEADPTLTEGEIGNAVNTDENPLVGNGVLVVEDKCLEELTDKNWKINVVNAEADPTLTEGGIRKAASTDENPSVGNGVLVEEDKCLEELTDKNGKINVVNTVANPSLTEGGIRNAASTNENPLAGNGVLVGVEGSVRDKEEIQDKLAVGKPECEAESETKKAEDSNVKIEKSEEVEVEVKFEDQNWKSGVVEEAEPAYVEDQLISEANQESKVLNPGMVADSGEEPNNLLSPSDKQETVENEVESALGNEALLDQKFDIDPENGVRYSLDKDKVVESNAVRDVIGTACDEILEAEGSTDDAVTSLIGNGATPQISVSEREAGAYGETPQISVSEREAGASGATQKIPASSAQVQRPANEVQISDAETAGVISSLPSDGSESESFGNEPIHLDSLEMCTADGVCSGSDVKTVVSNKTEPISQGSELSADSKDGCNPPVSAVKLEPEVDDSSAVDHVVVTSDKDATSGLEVIDNFVSEKGVSNSMLQSADVKAMVGGATESDDETLLLAKNEDTGNSCGDGMSMASPESGSDIVKEKDVNGVAVTKPFTFRVRTPRYTDEKLQEQIRIAELEVKEKTKLRDSIQAQIHERRAKNQNNGIDYETAKGEDRNVKKLLKEKRMEIDSLQSLINKAKNATSIEELNSRIKTVEHKIQHETLLLNEEKNLIQEIRQLKQLREQLSSSKCSQNEIQQALEQREQAEERLKTLRKELSNLKGTASKAQTACDEAEGKYNVEHKKVQELQAQFRAADDVRQEAYAKFLNLSKELSQKRKNFFQFKNDSATATYYAFTDDKKKLYRHCVNEVENFMELWNGNDEFRSQYVRLNARSTIRRFGTLDGRSLGPDEKPPILPSYVRERNDKVVSVPANTADSISRSPAMELKPAETKIENVSSDIHWSKKETESKEKTVGSDKSKQVKSLATVSDMDEEQEEPVKTKEELELIRKAEDIRRAETEAKLKEQLRLEEIVKAKEARERKQRRDEKAQKREELKARKEAEQKEKEREKKERKKERKKAATSSTSASTEQQDDASSITCVEISKEEASPQENDVSTKKPPKTSRVMVSKQNKTRSVPPPSLRNRNRRKWQQWMWVIVISLAVLVLFWLGNLGVFSSVNSKLQGSGF